MELEGILSHVARHPHNAGNMCLPWPESGPARALRHTPRPGGREPHACSTRTHFPPHRQRRAGVGASYPRWAPSCLGEWKAAGLGKAQPPPLAAPPGTGAGQWPVSVTPKGAPTGPGTQRSLRTFHSCYFTNRNPVSATCLHSPLSPAPQIPILINKRNRKKCFLGVT